MVQIEETFKSEAEQFKKKKKQQQLCDKTESNVRSQDLSVRQLTNGLSVCALHKAWDRNVKYGLCLYRICNREKASSSVNSVGKLYSYI